MNFNNQNTYSVSNILIVICLFTTLVVLNFPELYIFWMNTFFLERWSYITYILQFFTSQFIHWSVFHFIFNALFIFLFWSIVENSLRMEKYIIFFIFSSIFIWISLTIFSTWNTVWISWFAMALLSYYTLELYYKNDIEYKWWITALIINIWIGLSPWISLVGHFSWALAWVVFYFIYRSYFKVKYVWGEL
jgi:membrane associated rhomboid family serine protease